MEQLRILIAPNEDGFGPSALVSHIARELLEWKAPDCRLTIWNHRRLGFNRSLYAGYAAGKVRVAGVHNIIELGKDPATGRVSAPGTLELIGDYAARSRAYRSGIPAGEFDLVIEFGVPAAARWAAEHGKPCFSVFDHCWSKTLELIFESGGGADGDWRRLIADIREDEAFTGRLFLLPPFITPPVFRDHWRNELRVEPRELGAVLGGRPPWSRRRVLEFLALVEPGDTLLIQGGDTPAWDRLLEGMTMYLPAAACARLLERERINVVIYLPERVRRKPELEAVIGRIEGKSLPRVRLLPFVEGGTIQHLLPAVSLMLTRAGGGSVNDAVACRVAFVCVPEPAQPQVEAVLSECLRRGLTPEPLTDACGEHLLDGLIRTWRANRELYATCAGRMRRIPRRGERTIAAALRAETSTRLQPRPAAR